MFLAHRRWEKICNLNSGLKHSTLSIKVFQLKPPTAVIITASKFFRLQWAKNITRFQEMYINWNRLPRPLFEPQNFPACGGLKP
jgi:hypothetical protein